MTYGEFIQDCNKQLRADRLFDWRWRASPADYRLFEKVCEFSDMFEDMIFGKGSVTFDFIKCHRKIAGTNEWVDDTTSLPDGIEYFSYDSFTYHVKDLDDGCTGQFDGSNFSLSVAPEYIDDDSVILHEMIHLHELVIDLQPQFFHDALLFCLYRDLSKKISDLDERIEAHGHILNSLAIAQEGGVHDILFLLKSFDLDLRKGYKLGTVFGYEMAED